MKEPINFDGIEQAILAKKLNGNFVLAETFEELERLRKEFPSEWGDRIEYMVGRVEKNIHGNWILVFRDDNGSVVMKMLPPDKSGEVGVSLSKEPPRQPEA